MFAAIAVLVAGFLVATCRNKEAPVVEKMDPVEDFAKRYTAAWCSQDPASVAAFFSEGGSLTVNDGEPAVGRDAIAGVAQEFMTALPDMVLFFDGLEGELSHGRVRAPTRARLRQRSAPFRA